MSEAIICATERSEKPNRVRKEGFIPGVIYGKGIVSISIKLEQKEFKKLLQEHAKNTIVGIKIGEEIKRCILREIQRDPISGKTLNIELQAVHSDDIIQLKVPVVFHGREKLAGRQQVLQEYVSEVELTGKADIMPEYVGVDVGEGKRGDKITIKDIKVCDGIKILGNTSEVIAVISAIKEYSESEAG